MYAQTHAAVCIGYVVDILAGFCKCINMHYVRFFGDILAGV
jgi:hypothetical protein